MLKKTAAMLLVICLILTCEMHALATTTSEKNALRSAINYLSYTAFSRSGLIAQLEYEGYSTSDATYAVDNCNANWNEQALLCAKNYLNFIAFSKSGLESQLLYDGFTAEQANYGVNNCGADWKEQAVKCGRNYMSFMAFSESSLSSQLVYDGFSNEQVQYATTVLFHSNGNTATPKAATATPRPNQNKTPQQTENIANNNTKVVPVPVGEYIVGEDIPAGAYALSADKYATIKLYNNADASYYDESYSCEKPYYAIGKIVLRDGMKVQVSYATMYFSVYDKRSNWTKMENKEPTTILVGEYVIGEDIPAGSYSLSATQYATLKIYKNSSAKYYDNSYSCEKPDYKIGKVTLKDGMKIVVYNAEIVFEPYKGLGFW